MSKKTEVKKVEVKETPLKVSVTFPDGTTVNQELYLREFQPNIQKGFKNSGYQSKIGAGLYSGSIMIIDHARQVKL